MKDDDFGRLCASFRAFGPLVLPSFTWFRQNAAEVLGLHVSLITLRSIYAQEVERRAKERHYYRTSSGLAHYVWFTTQGSLASPGFVARHATECLGLSPALFARMLVEEHLRHREEEPLATVNSSSNQTFRQRVTERCRNPDLLAEDPILSREVFLCSLLDDVFGPHAEVLKFLCGQEHEQKLKNALRQREIPFMDEKELRVLGFDKTPDVRLVLPVLVDGCHVIHWIESKALFASKVTHLHYLHSQLHSYVNRFGGGLVIYWAGHVDEVAEDVDSRSGNVLVRDTLPEELCVFYLHAAE